MVRPLGAQYSIIVEKNVPAAMRDGTVLKADILRPDAPGPFPVLVNRGPYGKESTSNDETRSPRFFASHGYVVVNQDCRARFESEGDNYYPLIDEARDGYDTVEWAASLPWSNGKVGTIGQSYLGATQYLLAQNNPLPPHLKAMSPISASASFHDSWVYHTGGAMEWGWMVPYAIHMGRNTLSRKGLGDQVATLDSYVEGGNNFAMPLTTEAYAHLPLNDWIERLKDAAPYFGDYMRYADDGSYWRSINLLDNLAGINVPMLHISSWYDIFLEGALNAFSAITQNCPDPLARASQKLFIGPWAHLLPYSVPTSKGAGEADFGLEAAVAIHEMQLGWFDYWLKDQQTNVMNEPPVAIFVMGENRWRLEWEWPLARTRYTPFYLHSRGDANTSGGGGTLSLDAPGEEESDTYVYDPADPVPTKGGATLIIPQGVFDQRSVESRPDVLAYTSEPLQEDMEVTGPVVVELHAASSAMDTDFTAKLVDVQPDGYARNLQDGIIRARYRDSRESPSLLVSNQVYKYSIDLCATSYLFKAGHRVRLEISSSNFPRFDRNLNTGAPLGEGSIGETAKQTICHSASYPSHILLPVIPR